MTKKLHSRRKILDIPLYKETENKIILHQFGFYVLERYRTRGRPIDTEELLQFLKDTPIDVIDNIADEIPYKHKRVVFREYCKMVKKFIEEQNITEIKRENKEVKLKMLCKKKVKNVEGETQTIKHLEIGEHSFYGSGVSIKIVNNKGNEIDDFEIHRIGEQIEHLILFEQLEQEILKCVNQFKRKLKKSIKRVGEPFLKELKEKFSTYLVAEQL